MVLTPPPDGGVADGPGFGEVGGSSAMEVRRVGDGDGSLDGEGVGSGRATEVVAPVPRPVQETVCTVVAVSV